MNVPRCCRWPVAYLGVLCFLWTVPGRAESTLESRLRPLIERHAGTVAVAVKHLGTGEEYGYRDDEPMPTASLIKMAVMVEAYRQADAGKVDLNEALLLREADKVQGSGILTEHFSEGTKLPLRDLVRLMIAYSDNTATNLVLDRIGLASTSKTMVELGLPETKIHAKVFRGDTSIFPERSERFGLGSTTAAETLRLLELLHTETIARPESCREMREHLRACQDRDSLPRGLPAGTKLAHKTGAVTTVRTAAGILETPAGPIAVCVLTRDNRDRRWSTDNAAQMLCGRVARAAYDHFNPAEDPNFIPAELALGARGWLVEALQRTLNERLKPSPELKVDGELGPSTQQAVIAFQKQHELSAIGMVQRETWDKLGPLISENGTPPDADALVKSLADKSAADPLDGPPFVTCKAWAIGKADSGELLWGADETQSRHIASTTKLMSAWLALKLAKTEPQIFDEIVSVSQRADQTPGSTAGLRSGERLPLRDLLYGLLLPSGNDAAVALAEHLGERFDPPADRPDATDSLSRFVAEMNRAAAELGMSHTEFANPHGLSANGHRSTARDLLKLAAALYRDGQILEFTGTRKYLGTLEGPNGYRRLALWQNTNQLLDTEGYLGLKTGTTSAAGACLVSLGERGEDRLFVVVLGATSGDARYVDTRNLYRWAWQQRP